MVDAPRRVLVLGGVSGESDAKSIVGMDVAISESMRMRSFLGSERGYWWECSDSIRGAMGDCCRSKFVGL